MKWRKVSEGDVLKTLEVPDRAEMTIGGRSNAYKLVENRLLKVTYIRENSDTVVVTVIEKKQEME
jgi:hypothetical protein